MQKLCYNNEGELIMLAGAREFYQQLISASLVMWKEQSFSYMPQFYSQADAKKYTNLQISNVCQLKYAYKIPKYYQLCIIVKILFSKDSVVCTVIIAFNNRCAKSTQSLVKDELEVGTQRLNLLLMSNDFHGGKYKGLSGCLTHCFEKFVAKNPELKD